MAHVHDGSSLVFAKTNRQRPHDFSTGFCKQQQKRRNKKRQSFALLKKRANHGPCNRCVTLVVSLLKKSCKGHVISAFCKPWPNVHGSSSDVFAKTIMQRPRDTRRVFSKAWHMYMMVVVLSLLKPTGKGHMISAQVSVNNNKKEEIKKGRALPF